MRKHIHILLSVCLSGIFINSQAQKSGNIVEIFGKEKIESVAEGTVVHQFREGLALKNSMRPGLIHGAGDILFWEISSGQFERPIEGQALKNNYKKDPAGKRVWEKISTDSTGTFQVDLDRGYLYT